MPKLTDEQILDKEPYRSILNLFKMYSYEVVNNKFLKSVGLKSYHFMYALGVHKEKNEELENFFTKKLVDPKTMKHSLSTLKDVQDKEIIKKGCIRNSDRLDKCLKLLIRQGWVEAKGKPRYYIYHLADKYYLGSLIRSIVNEVYSWDKKNIIPDEIFNYILNSNNL